MKKKLGLDNEDESSIAMIINTSMSPWLRAQKSYKRLGTIIRNELYNAYGGVYDEPQILKLVSPNLLKDDWNGDLFAELEASFSNGSLKYHVIGKFTFPKCDMDVLKELARKASEIEEEGEEDGVVIPLRIATRNAMKVFDLMSNGENCSAEAPEFDTCGKDFNKASIKEKLKKYSDDHLTFDQIASQEIDVTVYFADKDTKIGEVNTRMKLKRIMRYQHLSREFVDRDDYPQNQEYFLYTDDNNAYISHCPNRYPDFQQQILLDNIPQLKKEAEEDQRDLYNEALRRGVIVYLPSIQRGGRPEVHVCGSSQSVVCRDPIRGRRFDAITWTDQGAFTGDMLSIIVSFHHNGRRWFSGKKINQDFKDIKFPEEFDRVESDAEDDIEKDVDNTC